MTAVIAALTVMIAAAIAEILPVTARLAGRLASWAAYRRYAGDPGRAARRAEEWQALACRRPGGRVLGLLTAVGFAWMGIAAFLAARRVTSAQVAQSAGKDEEGTAAVPAPAAPAPMKSVTPAGAVTAIYITHYRWLVRLAVLLVRDVATAEEVVQDSFIAMHAAWPRLQDTEKALSCLRQSVVNRSRSVLRHRVVVDKNAPRPGAISSLERSAVIAALRTLPPRQREALVLKYYADLSEAQIATAMGISRGAVKSHTAKGWRHPCLPAWSSGRWLRSARSRYGDHRRHHRGDRWRWHHRAHPPRRRSNWPIKNSSPATASGALICSRAAAIHGPRRSKRCRATSGTWKKCFSRVTSGRLHGHSRGITQPLIGGGPFASTLSRRTTESQRASRRSRSTMLSRTT